MSIKSFCFSRQIYEYPNLALMKFEAFTYVEIERDNFTFLQVSIVDGCQIRHNDYNITITTRDRILWYICWDSIRAYELVLFYYLYILSENRKLCISIKSHKKCRRKDEWAGIDYNFSVRWTKIPDRRIMRCAVRDNKQIARSRPSSPGERMVNNRFSFLFGNYARASFVE